MPGWFGPKRSGYGISPRGWQGWLATLLLIGGAILDAKFFRPGQFGLPVWTRPASAIALGVVYLLVVVLTYEADT
jgi:hypothetical protein